MILRSLSLSNFKNIARAELRFSPNINCFVGDNGMGKSNLLDAIHYLSFGKSFATLTDNELLRHGEDFAIMHAEYRRRDADETLSVGMQRGRRKSFKRGGKEYRRLSEHLGLFPSVMISPADYALVAGAPDERRRFIDMVLAQHDAAYYEALVRYNKALEQRNKLLRDEIANPTLYAAVEAQMVHAADIITDTRRRRIAALSEIFNRYYAAIAASSESVTLNYKSYAATDDHTPLAQLLDDARRRDTVLHYTSVGPHRDDLEMTLDEMPMRATASQGQAKTFTIALRLAQYEFLKQATGLKPLLLLDDIFDKLDASRVERIIKLVGSPDTFGQIFITDTNRKHLDEIMPTNGDDFKMWRVANGVFEPFV